MPQFTLRQIPLLLEVSTGEERWMPGHGAVGVGGGLSSQPPSRGVPCSLRPAEHQDASLRTVMPQAPALPGGAVSITAAVNPSSGEG